MSTNLEKLFDVTVLILKNPGLKSSFKKWDVLPGGLKTVLDGVMNGGIPRNDAKHLNCTLAGIPLCLTEYSDTVYDFTKVLKLDKKYTEALLNRGISHYYYHEYSEAIADWTKAKNMQPSLAPSLNDWIDKADYFMSNQ